MHLASAPPEDDFTAAMRQFIIDQGEGRTDETRERYAKVADDLTTFLAEVDVGPWLGPELAAHLDVQRERFGGGALMASLGLASFVRVLPAFVKEPWLPPPGAQRKTQRTVARRLLTFLRLRAQQAGCFRRDDFTLASKALGHYSAYDHKPLPGRTGTVSCTVTLDLVEHFMDRLLEEVTEERF